MLALDKTHLNKFVLSAELCHCVSGLIDDLSNNIAEYFFFVSSAVTIYNVPF